MTEALLYFALGLLAAVYISGLAHRTVLSTSVLFLAFGVALGGFGDVIQVSAEDPLVRDLTNVALFTVLFTDGIRLELHELRADWKGPARALLLGLPLTMALTAVAGHYVVGLTWPSAWLCGAALSSTDPIFAASLFGQRAVPSRLKHLLNVESGANDGLALPFVVLFIAWSQHSATNLDRVALELLGGVVLAVVIAGIASIIVRIEQVGVTHLYEPMFSLAVALLVFAVARQTHANEFLAAFVAGITTHALVPVEAVRFEPIGRIMSEVLKLGALFIFGALISTSLLADVGWQGMVFAVLILVLARPLAISIAFVGTTLSRQEWLTAAWFGPRGFASVFYGLIILQTGIPEARLIFDLIAVVVALSIIAHSSTDFFVARMFERMESAEEPPPAVTGVSGARGVWQPSGTGPRRK